MSIWLQNLALTNFRLFNALKLELHPGFNLFWGDNASGKTSILEAINFLGSGKSFRTSKIANVVNHNCEEFVIRALSYDSSLEVQHSYAMSKSVAGLGHLKLDNNYKVKLADFIKNLAVQFIDVKSNKLIEQGPMHRREFIDWGLFYLQDEYLFTWRAFKKSLEHRNALLKKNYLGQERIASLEQWDVMFTKYAEQLSFARYNYVQKFAAILQKLTLDLLKISAITLEYQPGWDQNFKLINILEQTRKYDLAVGSTSKGPQRAELLIKIKQHDIREVLSRGQLKLFICIMHVARSLVLQQSAMSINSSIYLLDDLPAELDAVNCDIFLQTIKSLGSQALVTAIEPGLITKLLPSANLHVQAMQELSLQKEFKASAEAIFW